MNWRLIFSLSLFGFLMAFATVFLIPATIEPFFWIPIFIVSAIIVAKNAYDKFFLHGLYIGIANSLWISFIHCLLFVKYIFNNGRVSEILASLPSFAPPRVMILIYGPMLGIVAGIILGLLCLGAARIFNHRTA